MKTTCNILLTLLLSFFATAAFSQVSFGDAVKIDREWKFTLEDVDDGEKPSLEDSKWQTLDLPHDWSVDGRLSPTLASCTGYLPGGIGWYRKTLDIPADKKGEKVYIYFEGVYNRSDVYLNGHHLGHRPNGYISFMYDATPYIDFGGDNVLAVRVDHSRSADSRWYTGSGIYRDVWMVTANPLHIAEWGVFAYPKTADSKHGVLAVKVEIENHLPGSADITVVNELFDPSGKQVAKSSKKLSLAPDFCDMSESELKVGNPKLWSITNPSLYTLRTTILRNGSEIDRTETRTGFRTFTFDPDRGFALNGEWMKMKGVCLHHDAGVLGSAVPREVLRARLEKLREIGVNAIRTSHNPQAPILYELCDEMGFLVMDEYSDEWEFHKRKWLEGWNVGTPGFQGSYDFFEEWGERDLADMVRRDRNHMSIFAWSIGNEVDYPNDPYSHPILDGAADGRGGFTQPIFGGYKKDAPNAGRLGAIARKFAVIVRENDPSRAVTAGLAGVAMSNETDYPFALDIAGYNYTESRYLSDHEKYPERVIFGSENRHDLSAWHSVSDNDHIFGQFLWTGIDYLGESGPWPSRGFYSGLMDFAGNIKPRGYFRMSLWADKPMVRLGTYPAPGNGRRAQNNDVWSALEAENGIVDQAPSMDAWPLWNYPEGQTTRVVCYTNAAKVQLTLDGQPVGQPKEYNKETGIIYWDIPFRSGELKAIAMDANDNTVATHAIASSERPTRLRITEATQKIPASRGVSIIRIQAFDDNDILAMLSDEEVTCRITGPGRLLGLEAGNNSDMGDYTDNRQRLFNGQLTAYIEATGQPGEITVEFTAPWPEGDRVTIVGF